MKYLFLLIIFISKVSFAEVKIAVIDSGISKDSISNVKYDEGYNFVTKSNKFPKVEIKHGSFIIKVISENKNVSIYPYQIGLLTKDNTQEEKNDYFNSYLKSIKMAIDNKVDIINISLAGDEKNEIEELFLNLASDLGIKIIVAAGNEGINIDSHPKYPCSYKIKNLKCVSSLDKNNKKDMNYGNKVVKYLKSERWISLHGKKVGMKGSSIAAAIESLNQSK